MKPSLQAKAMLPDPRRSRLGILCVILLLVPLGCGGDLMIMPYAGGPSEELLDSIGPISPGDPIPAAAPYSADAPVHPIIVFSSSKPMALHPYSMILPQEWVPEAVDSLQLVAYLGDEERYALQTCDYYGGPPITRYQFVRQVDIYQAKTGALLTSFEIRGSEPDRCPQTAPQSAETIEGTQVFADTVVAGLREYVEEG